jgi:hypothetical protein
MELVEVKFLDPKEKYIYQLSAAFGNQVFVGIHDSTNYFTNDMSKNQHSILSCRPLCFGDKRNSHLFAKSPSSYLSTISINRCFRLQSKFLPTELTDMIMSYL